MRVRLLVVFLLMTGTAFSQTFTGTLDGYWSYNSAKPLGQFNTHRAFDVTDQQFSFSYGELAIDYKPNRIGFRADLGIGDTAEIVHSSEPDIWRHVQQIYITATQGGWTFDFGKFVTPIGAEVIETKDNWNYSRGLLFTKAIPFYHFGARTTGVINDRFSVGAYLVNGWDNVRDNNTAKSVGFNTSIKPGGNTTFIVNYLVGKETPSSDDKRHVAEGIFIWDLTSSFSLMGDYNFGKDGGDAPTATWQGVAGYAKVNFMDRFILVPRYEWFSDRDGFRTGVIQNIESMTLTGQIPVDEAKLWLEYRRDWSTAPTFNATENDLPTVQDNQNTFTVGLTYTFTRETKYHYSAAMKDVLIQSLQPAIRAEQLDGWLFYSFHGSDPNCREHLAAIPSAA